MNFLRISKGLRAVFLFFVGGALASEEWCGCRSGLAQGPTGGGAEVAGLFVAEGYAAFAEVVG